MAEDQRLGRKRTISETEADRRSVGSVSGSIFVHAAGPTCGTVQPPPFFGRTENDLRARASATFYEMTDYEARVNDPEEPRTLFVATLPDHGGVATRNTRGHSELIGWRRRTPAEAL